MKSEDRMGCREYLSGIVNVMVPSHLCEWSGPITHLEAQASLRKDLLLWHRASAPAISAMLLWAYSNVSAISGSLNFYAMFPECLVWAYLVVSLMVWFATFILVSHRSIAVWTLQQLSSITGTWTGILWLVSGIALPLWAQCFLRNNSIKAFFDEFPGFLKLLTMLTSSIALALWDNHLLTNACHWRLFFNAVYDFLCSIPFSSVFSIFPLYLLFSPLFCWWMLPNSLCFTYIICLISIIDFYSLNLASQDPKVSLIDYITTLYCYEFIGGNKT